MARRTQQEMSETASHRTVVMLRSRERKRLERLAAAANVSSAEIVRRAILAYDPQEKLELLVGAWRESTERAIKSVERARAEVQSAVKHVDSKLAAG